MRRRYSSVSTNFDTVEDSGPVVKGRTRTRISREYQLVVQHNLNRRHDGIDVLRRSHRHKLSRGLLPEIIQTIYMH